MKALAEGDADVSIGDGSARLLLVHGARERAIAEAARQTARAGAAGLADPIRAPPRPHLERELAANRRGGARAARGGARPPRGASALVRGIVETWAAPVVAAMRPRARRVARGAAMDVIRASLAGSKRRGVRSSSWTTRSTRSSASRLPATPSSAKALAGLRVALGDTRLPAAAAADAEARAAAWRRRCGHTSAVDSSAERSGPSSRRAEAALRAKAKEALALTRTRRASRSAPRT